LKKIIVLIKPHPPLLYFVNQIHRSHSVHTVIIEDDKSVSLSTVKKLRTKIIMGAKAIKNPRVPIQVKSRKMVNLYNRYFKNDWLDLDESLRVIYCNNINEPNVEHLLEKEKPDLLLDHGTSIVKDHIIEKAPLALNLHWGLSPYYRGTHCTEWALVNWDPFNIGVTIHLLAREIDGGDVLGQGRVSIKPEDSVDSINMKLTREGTKIIIDVLQDWQKGIELQFCKQDFSRGFLTLNRQWGRVMKKEIQRIDRDAVISQMVKTPARREKLPIIKFKQS
jgi:hypothetical protein